MAFQIENGVLLGYTDEDDTKEITVPDGVTEIGTAAFVWSGLHKIILPESVECIREEAFSNCLLLEHIHIPSKITRIPEKAFFLCPSLMTIDLPDTITEIGEGAFESCLYLHAVCIPPAVTRIASHTFDSCLNLQQVVIPNGVTEIGECAFKECTRLRTVVVPDSVVYIGDDAFKQCTADIILLTEEARIRFPHLKTQTAADRQYVLDFICAKDLTQRETIFRRMKQLRHKAPLVLYLLDRQRSETVQEYLHSRVRHLMEYWIQENDASSIGRFLPYGYVTAKHIDGMIELAIACRATKSQSVLLHYKNKIGYTAPGEQFRI